MDNFTAVCMLGDLFPTEWPPAGGLRRGTTHHPAPTEMRNRVAFARSIEPATDLFRQLIKEAANSESRIMRCALVRLCARASGRHHDLTILSLLILLTEWISHAGKRQSLEQADQDFLVRPCQWHCTSAFGIHRRVDSCWPPLPHLLAPYLQHGFVSCMWYCIDLIRLADDEDQAES